MNLKTISISDDILYFLSDSKVHTLQELAEEIEVSKKTIFRHIQMLSYHYPIQTFCGGNNRGGVKLDSRYIKNGKVLTKDELQLINKALLLLQKSKSENVNNELLNKLLQVYSLPDIERRIENGEREKSL